MGGAHWYNLANTIESSVFGGSAKMAEPIEMLLRVWTQMGQRNHVLDGGADHHM